MRFKFKHMDSIQSILLLLGLMLQHVELTPFLLAIYPTNNFCQQLQNSIEHLNPNFGCTKSKLPNQAVIYSKKVGRSYRFFTFSFRPVFLLYALWSCSHHLQKALCKTNKHQFHAENTAR